MKISFTHGVPAVACNVQATVVFKPLKWQKLFQCRGNPGTPDSSGLGCKMCYKEKTTTTQ